MNTNITPTASGLPQRHTGLAMKVEEKFIATISSVGCPNCGADGQWRSTRTEVALLTLECSNCSAVITFSPGSSVRSETERLICDTCGSNDLEPIESDRLLRRYRCKACGAITQR